MPTETKTKARVAARLAWGLSVAVAGAALGLSGCKSHPIPEGRWSVGVETASLAVPEVRVAMDLERTDARGWRATFLNAAERIEAPVVFDAERDATISFPHYQSELDVEFVRVRKGWEMRGAWVTPRRDGVARVPLRGVPLAPAAGAGGVDDWTRRPAIRPDSELNAWASGRWAIDFEKSDDAVGVFEIDDLGHAVGTVLTPTGDYRHLAGWLELAPPPDPPEPGDLPESMRDPRELERERRIQPRAKLYLSTFDGSHAFALLGNITESGMMWGVFTSGNWWTEGFTATRDDDAELPDAFAQTRAVGSGGELALAVFRDLEGRPASVGDAIRRAHGVGEGVADGGAIPGPTLIEVFGTWCPNCHDAGAYLAELHERYAGRGLGIVGLAFELKDDPARNAQQVRAYHERHTGAGEAWPVLIAGLSNKDQASAALPVLDKVRSYPTTIFMAADGSIRAVHTGFAGPATGDEHRKLRTEWEGRIESLLREAGR